MTVLLTELAPSLQKLVDARLDNIDRALLSTDITRYERRQIVSAVEDQIQELVARLDKSEPEREDLLRILASLDPPEAYGSGSMQGTSDFSKQSESRPISVSYFSPRVAPKGSVLAIIGVVLAGLSLLIIPGVFVLDLFAFAFSVLFSLAALICGVITLCQLWNVRGQVHSKGMAILGIASLPVGLVTMLLFFIVLGG